MKPLRRIRTEKNLTQVALALASGVEQSTISRLERDEDKGGVSWETAGRLARALGVEPAELFPLTDENGTEAA